MDPQHQENPVHVIFRYPFKRPADFQPPQLKQTAEEWSLEEQVWRCLLSLPGPDRPQDILAELEQDEVTFDWELLASTLQVSLSQVFEAASNLFVQHLGRPLDIVEESIQYTRNTEREQQMYDYEQAAGNSKEVDSDGVHASSAPAEGQHSGGRDDQNLVAAVGDALQEAHNSEPPPKVSVPMRADIHSSVSLDLPPDASDFDRAGLRSVESLGRDEGNEESTSPAVDLGTSTPDDASDNGDRPNEDDNRTSYPQDSDRSMQTASITTRRKDVPAPNPMTESRHLQNIPALANKGLAMHAESPDDQLMRQSMLADAMGSQFEPAGYTQTRRNTTADIRPPPSRQHRHHRREKQVNEMPSLNNRDSQRPAHSSTRDEKQPDSDASSLSFSDLSASSLTESAMQDALLSEAMNASTTMSSILGSRVFPWSKKKKPQKNRD
ncbi:hypothetical protein LPJ59_004215 [Coemansia sp. RSA 2399]|nr:hypothetical protein LPJ59_004215 [Coemansia sp. RSA 2399]